MVGWSKYINQSQINTILSRLITTQSEVEEVENHIHSNERWFEKAAVANGELHVADRLGEGSGSFQADAGNDDWGAWIQILGSEDTPADPGKVSFDGHRAEFTATERNATYYVQVVAQNTNPNTQGIEDETSITEFPLNPLSNQIDSGPVEIQSVQVLSGTKIWMRCMCPGQDTGTLNFLFGIHEYP